MAITPKPKSPAKPGVDIEALINKGGSPAATARTTEPEAAAVRKNPRKPKVVVFTTRVPGDLVERIDRLVNNRTVKPSRHSWILEALFEKAEREESK